MIFLYFFELGEVYKTSNLKLRVYVQLIQQFSSGHFRLRSDYGSSLYL